MFKRIAPIEVSDELAVPGRRPWASALRARCVTPPLTVCVAPVGITPPADGGTPRCSPQRTWMWGTSAPVALVVDCAPRSYRNPSEFELTVSLLCSLGFRALADGAALAVIARGCAFTIGNEVDLVDLAARLDLDAFDREIFPELHRRTASLRPALTVLTGSRSALAPLARQLAAVPNRGELAIVRSEPDDRPRRPAQAAGTTVGMKPASPPAAPPRYSKRRPMSRRSPMRFTGASGAGSPGSIVTRSRAPE